MNNLYDLINDKINSNKSESLNKIGTIILEGAKCNAACDYCFIKQCHEEASQTQIDEQAIRSTLKTVKIDSSKNYIVLWAGEPLFNKEAFIKLCEIINSELPKTNIIINTNGFLLNSEWAEFLIKHNVYVNLSHDGPGQKYRGFDYFNSKSHVKAINELAEANHLLNIETVIHKYNCSFNDIKDFFEKAQNEKGIIPKDYDFLITAPNLDNKIIYDFDYMDPALISYVQNCIQYLLEGIIQNKSIYVGIVSQIWDVLKHQKDSINPDILFCQEITYPRFSINSLGYPKCTRGFFNRNKNNIIAENHKMRCLKCNIKNSCLMCSCIAVDLDDNLCSKLQNRTYTIINTFNAIMDIWRANELSK